MTSLLLAPDILQADNEATLLLDSHFQSVDDLRLDGLLQEAQRRHEELQANLFLSQKEVDTIISGTQTKARAYLHSAQEMSLLRHAIADDLTDLSQQLRSDVALEERQPTLLEDIETLQRNLKELTSIKGYVQVIEHALSLSESCFKQIQSSALSLNTNSISGYRELQDFVSTVRNVCRKSSEISSESQPLHLITFLESLETKTWAEIKTILFNILLASSERLGWPMQVNYVKAASEDRATFEKAFHNLLKLQKLGEKIGVAKEGDGLYPFQGLVQPISLRFKYHFEGSRQTNRLDKPEWYYTHVQNLAHDHRPFMETVIQSLLSSTEYANINAWREFIFVLLPVLSRKMKRTMSSLLPHPPLLAHTIYQALIFDAALREQGFQLKGTSAQRRKVNGASEHWTGISEVILGNEEWFNAWLTGESEFADDQYHAIISSSDAWVIVDDDGEDVNQDFRPTVSARRLKALIEQITDRYSPLPRAIQRARFLERVQLPILEAYNKRIGSSLDAYEALSFAFIRAVPGALTVSFGTKDEGGVNVDTRNLTAGAEGVQRLCKAFLSAAFLESTLEKWGEELFFLDLWAQMSSDPPLREQVEANPLLPNMTADKGKTPTNIVFDELISRYTKVIVRAEDMIVHQTCIEVESHFKAHLAALASTKSDTEQANSNMAVSQTLLVPIALLSSHLTLIRSTFPQTTLTALYRRIASRLAEHILQRQILYRGQLSLAQGKLVAAECELWVETCHVALAGRLAGGRYRVETSWLKLLHAGRLVALDGDEWVAVKMATLRDLPDEEWIQLMTRVVGLAELDKSEVDNVIRRREDY